MNNYMITAIVCIYTITFSAVLNASAEQITRKSSLEQFVFSSCQKEICGICKEPKAEIYWFNPHSQCAHKACYNLILPALSIAYQKLDKTFSINPDNKDAHQTFTTFLQEKIGNQTFKEFATKAGLKALEKMSNETIDEAIQHIRDNR